jgi:hypothetical protein
MRDFPRTAIEAARVPDGPYGTSVTAGCNGAFVIKLNGHVLKVMASDGNDQEAQGWEHVSVSCRYRTPTWREMNWVKDQFWNEEEVVFQLHPKKSEYVNCHPYCLHMWRHKVVPCPCPPSIFVGPPGEGGNHLKEEGYERTYKGRVLNEE